MVFLEIQADIFTNKQLEFSQSKLAFINDVQKSLGYVNFLEKPGYQFEIQISWDNRKSLDEFIKSDRFHFFKGALVALSKKNTITISKEEIKNQTIN